MGVKFVELKDRARALIRVASETVTDEKLTVFVNDAIQEHANAGDWSWLERTVELSLEAGVGRYDVPEDFRRVKRVWVDRYDMESTSPLDMPYLQSATRSVFDPYIDGRVARWRYAQEGRSLLIAPLPETDTTAHMVYLFSPPPYTRDFDDTVIPLQAVGSVARGASLLAAGANLSEEQYEILRDEYQMSVSNLRDSEDSGSVFPAEPRTSPYTRNPMRRGY